MQRRALLIDAMGTLVHLEDPVGRLVAALHEHCGLEVGAEQAAGALRAEITYYRAHMQQGSDARRLGALHRDCAAVLRDALGVSAELDGMVAALLGALAFTAFPDAAPALRRARRTGARVVVVSNWDVSLAEVLARVGLAPLVDDVVTSAAVGARKPDPAIFARALEVAGVRASQCLHVGDSPVEDVAGARAAGIEAVLLARVAGGSVVAPGVGREKPAQLRGATGVRCIAGLGEL